MPNPTIKSVRNRTISLAAVYQASELVHNIAEMGRSDSGKVRAMLHSVLDLNASDFEQIYPDLGLLEDGLNRVVNPVNSDKNMIIARYGALLIHLARKVMKEGSIQQTLSEGIDDCNAQLTHLDLMDSSFIARLADIYFHTISTMQPRIMVSGDPLHLENSNNTNMIRALLLSGIRAGVLWHQCGGGRLKMLMERSAMQKEARLLLGNPSI